MKIAVLFSGQGAQSKDMGLDFIHLNEAHKDKAQKMSEILGFDFMNTLSDETLLNQTRYTQPLMIGIEILIHDYLVKNGLKVDGYSGFSLGEYAALYASGVYDFESIMKLINYRAYLMGSVSETTNGKMAAILGLDEKLVEKICKEVSTPNELVVAANYNSDNQTVISGSEKAVLSAIEKLKEMGAKRALLLNVSGAFHSPYMKESGLKLKHYAEGFKANALNNIVYKNTDALPLVKEDVLKEIEQQISSPVYFHQTIKNMIKDGYTHFLEIGPGQVLTALVKKVSLDVVTANVSKVEDIEKIKGVFI